MVTSVVCATRRGKYLTRKGLWSQDHPKHIDSYWLSLYTRFHMQLFRRSVFKQRFFLLATLSTQVETKIPAPQHLITNLAYKLKLHHKRKQYLRARLDTCAAVNIIPASVYWLIFDDPKLDPSRKLEIGTYTTDKIKVIVSCILFAVYPDTQCLKEVAFHVTSHEGSVVLSHVTTLELSLIQFHNILDHIPSSV